MPILEVKNLKKSYNNVEIIQEINLSIEKGDFLVLLGPSGCGKSTFLNIIAGLETLTNGQVFINEKDVSDVAPKDRDIAMVFQSYALYPNMSVARNITFGMNVRGRSKEYQEEALHRVAKQLQIEHLLDRKPSQLSGGQRQRVAMGRALVRKPTLFLFDEPLSNLDAKLRTEMRSEIKKLHHQLQASVVYVTHDQIEAMSLATKVVLMHKGSIQQMGKPKELYDYPASVFVANFMGSPSMNLINGVLKIEGEKIYMESEFEKHKFDISHYPFKEKPILDKKVILGIKPECITSHESKNSLCLECAPITYDTNGFDKFITFEYNKINLIARFDDRQDVEIGVKTKFYFNLDKCSIFDLDSELRL